MKESLEGGGSAKNCSQSVGLIIRMKQRPHINGPLLNICPQCVQACPLCCWTKQCHPREINKILYCYIINLFVIWFNLTHTHCHFKWLSTYQQYPGVIGLLFSSGPLLKCSECSKDKFIIDLYFVIVIPSCLVQKEKEFLFNNEHILKSRSHCLSAGWCSIVSPLLRFAINLFTAIS